MSTKLKRLIANATTRAPKWLPPTLLVVLCLALIAVSGGYNLHIQVPGAELKLERR